MPDIHQSEDVVAANTQGPAPTENPTIDEPLSAPPLDPAYESRRQRIFDHRVEAQEDPNTMTACLAGVNSDLLDCELAVGEGLRQGLATAGRSLDEIERYAQLINLLIRLSKQVAQITQLEFRSRKDGGEDATPKPR